MILSCSKSHIRVASKTLQAHSFGNWGGIWKGAGIPWSAWHPKNALEKLYTTQAKDDSAWLDGSVPGEAYLTRESKFSETAVFWRVFLQRAMSKFPYVILQVR